MTYISSDGRIGGGGGWSLSTIPNLLWGFVNFIVLFFQTMINPDLTKRGNGYSSNYRSTGRGPPPGPPSRRMGRLRGNDSPGIPPMPGGG